VSKQIVVVSGNKRSVPARAVLLADVEDERVFWVVLVGCPVHGVGFAPEHTAGHDECFAGRFRGFEVDAVVLVRLGGEYHGVDLVAEFDGELE